MDDRISLTVTADTSGYEAALQKAAKRLADFQQIEKTTIEVLKTFSTALDGSVKADYAVKLAGISREGEKINQSFKLVEGTLQQVAEKMSKLDSLSPGNKKVEALTKRIEGQVSPLQGKIDPGEQVKYNVAKAQLDELVKKHQGSLQAIKEMWKSLELGKVQKVGDLGLAQLQSKMLEVINLRNKMASPDFTELKAFNKQQLVDAKAQLADIERIAKQIKDQYLEKAKAFDKQQLKDAADAAKTLKNDLAAADAEYLKLVSAAKLLAQTQTTRTQVSPLINTLTPGKNAAPDTVLDLTAAKNKLVEFLTQNQNLKSQVNTVWSDVAKGSIQEYSGKLAKLQELIFALRLAHADTGHAAGASMDAALKASKDLAGHLDAQQQRLSQLNFSWQTMFRLIISQAASRAISALTSEVHQSAEEALKLSEKLAAITTVDKTGLSIEAWSTSLRAISESSGLGMLDATAAAYAALSNQVGEGAQVFGFLKEANDLAITGLATSTQTVDLLSSAINSYGLNISEVGDVAAKFFKIVELGRVTIPEMSSSLGRLLPMAAQVGVSIDEMGAAIALTTVKGVKFEVASTFLRNVLSKLAKPTKDMSEWFRELGYESGESLIKAKGFEGFLTELEKKAHGSSTELAALFKDIRAISGATIFAGQNLKLYGKNLEAIADSTAAYQEQVAKMKDTIGHEWAVASDKIKNMFTLDISTPFLKQLSALTNKFQLFVDTMEVVKVVLTTLASGAVVLLISGLKDATLALNAFLIAANFHPVTLAVAALAAAVGLVISLNESVEEKNAKLFADWQQGYNDTADAALKAATESQRAAEAAFDETMKPFRQQMAEKQKLLNAEIDLQESVRDKLKTAADASKDTAIAAINKTIEVAKAKASELKSEIKDLKSAAEKAFADIQKLKQDQTLTGKSASAKIVVLDESIKDLARSRDKANAADDIVKFKEFSALLDTAFKERKSLIESAVKETGDVVQKYKTALDSLNDELVKKQTELSTEKDAKKRTSIQDDINAALTKRLQLTNELQQVEAGVKATPIDKAAVVSSIRGDSDIAKAEKRGVLAEQEAQARLSSSDVLKKAQDQEIASKELEKSLLEKMSASREVTAAATDAALATEKTKLDSVKDAYEKINDELGKKKQSLEETEARLTNILSLTQGIASATGGDVSAMVEAATKLQGTNLAAAQQLEASKKMEESDRTVTEGLKTAFTETNTATDFFKKLKESYAQADEKLRPGASSAGKFLFGNYAPLERTDVSKETFNNSAEELRKAAEAFKVLATNPELTPAQATQAKADISVLKTTGEGDSVLAALVLSIKENSAQELLKAQDKLAESETKISDLQKQVLDFQKANVKTVIPDAPTQATASPEKDALIAISKLISGADNVPSKLPSNQDAANKTVPIQNNTYNTTNNFDASTLSQEQLAAAVAEGIKRNKYAEKTGR